MSLEGVVGPLLALLSSSCSLKVDSSPVQFTQIKTTGVLISAIVRCPILPTSRWELAWSNNGTNQTRGRVYCMGAEIRLDRETMEGGNASGFFEKAHATGVFTIRLSVVKHLAAHLRATQAEESEEFFITLLSSTPYEFDQVRGPIEVEVDQEVAAAALGLLSKKKGKLVKAPSASKGKGRAKKLGPAGGAGQKTGTPKKASLNHGMMDACEGNLDSFERRINKSVPNRPKCSATPRLSTLTETRESSGSPTAQSTFPVHFPSIQQAASSLPTPPSTVPRQISTSAPSSSKSFPSISILERELKRALLETNRLERRTYEISENLKYYKETEQKLMGSLSLPEALRHLTRELRFARLSPSERLQLALRKQEISQQLSLEVGSEVDRILVQCVSAC